MSVISPHDAALRGKPPGVDPLFAPLRLGEIHLRHRVVLGPWPLRRALPATGVPTPGMVAYYAQRATPGGLVVCEPVRVAPGDRDARTPGLFTADQVNHWRDVTDAIHAREAYAVAHLTHPGVLQPGRLAVLEGVLEDYRTAAENAGDAGFDAVELDAAPTALPSSLVAGYARPAGVDGAADDGRGLRLLTDVVQALTGVWPAQRVGVWLRAGRGALPIAERLASLDIGYLHAWAGAPGAMPALRGVFAGPLVLVGPGPLPQGGLPALPAGVADAISFGEAFASRPDLVARMRQGRLDAP